MKMPVCHFVFSLLLTAAVATSAFGRQSGQEQDAAQDLFSAAQNGDLEQVRAALQAGADVNAKTRYSATAISFASEKGHLEIVKLLIENGADPNVRDTFYNFVPLQWAQFGQHKEVAKFLKENGAKIPTLKSDPERSKKKAGTGQKKAEADDDKATEFAPDSAESKMADRRVSSVNWPGFRGTGARGVADGQNPPVTWNVAEDENVLWKTPIDGLGHSCPVVFGDRVYLTSAVSSAGDNSIKPGNYGGVDSVDDESEHSFIVICLDRNDGSVIWQKEAAKGVPKVKRHLKSTHANPTVATDGTHVIAFFAGEGLFCYSASGELMWSKDLGMLDSGWFYDKSYQWGFGSSPTIFEDFVIVQCDVQEQSFVAAYRLADGSEVWKTERDEIPGWSSPTVVDSPRGPMLLTSGTGFARGYDARNGEEWWRFAKFSEIVVPTPFVAHDLIYLTSGYSPIQPIVALSLDAAGDVSLEDGETSGEHVAWYSRKGGPYMPTPVVYGDYMYLCSNNGRLTVLQATTGKTVYRQRLNDGLEQLDPDLEIPAMSFVGSPVAADGHIYFPNEYGYVFVLKAGPEFELVAVNPVGENVLTTPAISQGVFFIRGQKHLFALQARGE